MSPKVSICIPAYKRVAFLKKALQSVLEQSYNDYEIIVTDDTPDNSVEELLKEFEFNGKLKYYHNSNSLGSPDNWNLAVSKAEGEYVKILHCDDYFTSSDSLGKYVELMERNPDSDFGFSSTLIVSIPGNIKKAFICDEKHFNRIKSDPYYLFFRNMIGAPSATIYRRTCNMKYDSNLKWIVDIDLYIAFIQANKNIANTKDVLICTVDGGEGQITQSVMIDKDIQIREHIYIFNKFLDRGAKLDLEKFHLFFQILFYQYKVKDIAEIDAIFKIPDNLRPFFDKVFVSLHKRMLWTRIKIKLYNTAINKKLLKLEVY